MKILQISGYKMLLLTTEIEEGVFPDPDIADVWVVNYTNRWHIRRFLRNIIRSDDPRIFLKPVFLQQDLMEFDVEDKSFYNLDALCDGYLKDLDLTAKIPLIEGVRNFIRRYDFSSPSALSKPIQNLFCYYFTRRTDLVPIRSHKSLTGYAYPRLEAYFYDRSTAYKAVHQLLQETWERGYLKREYITTTHLCTACSSGFLNYREKCPKCGHHDLVVRNVIHHFRCAYVGIQTDFVKNGTLVCPKCSQELRNLGVDYDRPGIAYVCLNDTCGHQFQKPVVGAQCINCGTENAPDELHVKKIYRYLFSDKGYAEINKGLH